MMLSKTTLNFIGLLGSVLWLGGCAGGANLYAQPVAEFAQAVEQTSQAVDTYSTMEQRLTVADTIARTAQSNGAIGFSAADCDPAKSAVKCQLTDFKTKAPLLPATTTTVPPEVVLMDKMRTYAQLLVSIAGAADEAELLARQKQAAAAYGDLTQGVKDAKGGDLGAAEGDLKDAILGGLGSIFLENKRTELLAKLVKAGDPVVAAVADTLSSLTGDVEDQFVISQRSRVGQLVDNFDVMSMSYKPNMSAQETALYQTLRRTTLEGAVRETATLQTVLASNPKAAFSEMKQAHAALLRALVLADSDLGMALTALENFSAAARKASGAFDALKGQL